MCGIAAAINWPSAERVVKDLIAGVAHRGLISDPLASPSPKTALGVRRLPIVGRDKGAQPQLSSDGRILLVFNGEIYNHKELGKALVLEGASFSRGSDTEVLASALQSWGAGALARLRGMFAFVALDLQSGEFLAARDPFGEKPLYLIQNEEGWLFSSEIAPLLKASETGQVMLLPPGYLLTRTRCRPYFTLPDVPSNIETCDPDELDRRMRLAVERCMPLDLPCASFFSGGIDSTLITHYARQIRPETPAYFLGGDSAPDFPYAANYAEKTGLDLRTVPLQLDGQTLFNELDETIGAIESFEPSVVRPSLCSLTLSRAAAKDGHRVILTGEGADELFCGYGPLEYTYAESDEFGRHVRDQCLSLLNRTALQRVDRTAMRFQIEARSPFLDLEVAELALGLGAKALLRRFNGELQGKAPLRALYELYPEALPKMIKDRSKAPFNEGAGLDASQNQSEIKIRVEERVSDREFKSGQARYADYGLETKEAYFYLTRLNAVIDIERVPHLKGRLQISSPSISRPERLRAFTA